MFTGGEVEERDLQVGSSRKKCFRKSSETGVLAKHVRQTESRNREQASATILARSENLGGLMQKAERNESISEETTAEKPGRDEIQATGWMSQRRGHGWQCECTKEQVISRWCTGRGRGSRQVRWAQRGWQDSPADGVRQGSDMRKQDSEGRDRKCTWWTED